MKGRKLFRTHQKIRDAVRNGEHRKARDLYESTPPAYKGVLALCMYVNRCRRSNRGEEARSAEEAQAPQ